ncbi:MAG: UbiA family prenyltransferase [Thaumarchaeota archaeon]|nr:UbiA family prenyltransferase [Nitrososphaerota archaeon]
MSIFTSIYNELVFGGHLLSLGTASIAATCSVVLGRNPPIDLLVIAYLFSHASYTLNRATEIDQDTISHPGRTAYVTKRKNILFAIVPIEFLVGFALAMLKNMLFFLALFLPLVLAGLYSLGAERLVKLAGANRFKEKLIVKNITASSAWSLIPLIVCLYFPQISAGPLLLTPFIFLRLLSNTVFFDIRDVKADRAFGTRTIPSVYGMGAADVFMRGADIAAFCYIVLVTSFGLVPYFALTLAVFPIYSFIYRYLSRSVDKDTIRDLIADGEFALWAPAIYLAKI